MDIFKYKNGKFIISEGYGSAKTSEELEEGIMDLFGSKKKEEPQPAQKPIPGTENPKTFARISLASANTIVDIEKLSKMPNAFYKMLDKMYAWGNKNGIKFNEEKITNELDQNSELSLSNDRKTPDSMRPKLEPVSPFQASDKVLSKAEVGKRFDPRVGPTPSGPLRE